MRGRADGRAGDKLVCRVVVERRPVIKHVEPWMEEYEAWTTANRVATMGREDATDVRVECVELRECGTVLWCGVVCLVACMYVCTHAGNTHDRARSC